MSNELSALIPQIIAKGAEFMRRERAVDDVARCYNEDRAAARKRIEALVDADTTWWDACMTLLGV